METTALNDLIAKRRSIYPNLYTGEVVDDQIIRQMLENANWAPTHGLTEPWRFKVFKGEGIRKLAEFQSELYKTVKSARGDFDEATYLKLATKPLKASHIVSIGMKRDAKGKIPEIEEVEAVACAVQNMYLTATAYGIGCYWGSGGVTYFDEARPFFGLGDRDKLLGFMYIGMPRIEWPEGKRAPIDQKVEWELG